jgi:hypothetical protein
LLEDGDNLFRKLPPEVRGIEQQQATVEIADSHLCSSQTEATRRRLEKMAKPFDFRVKLGATSGSEPVGLLIARCVFLLEALNPSILKQTVDCPVQCAGAESNTPLA